MPEVKCIERGCEHTIVISEKAVDLLIGIVLTKKPTVAGDRILTLECWANHRHNYTVTFKNT